MLPLAFVAFQCLTELVGSSLLTGEFLSIPRTASVLPHVPADVALVNLSDSLFFHEWKLWAQNTPGAESNPVLSNQRVVGLPIHMHPFGDWVVDASLRVGKSGTGTKAHRDYSDTLVVIVSGKKLVTVWQANATSEEEHILSEGEAIFLPSKVLHQTRDLAANVVSAVFRGGKSVAEIALTAYECAALNNGVPGCFKQPWESTDSPCTYCKCELAPSFDECPAGAKTGFTGYFVPSEPFECGGLFKFPSGSPSPSPVSPSVSPSPASASPSPSPTSASPSPSPSHSPTSSGSNNGLYGLFALFAIPLLLLPLCGLAYWWWARAPAPVPMPEYVQPVQMVQQPVQYVQQPQYIIEEYPKQLLPPSPVHYVQQPMQFMQAAPMQAFQSVTPTFAGAMPMAFA